MTAVLALTGALIIGASDFAGGYAARRDPAVRVTAWVQGISLFLLALALVPFGWSEVVTRDLVAGVIAGLSGTFSFIGLYKSFTLGPISLMAPTAAVMSAIIPTGVGALRGETMSAINLVGVVLGVAAIVLVSQDRLGVKDSTELAAIPWRGFALAAVAGTGFSVFFLALAETNPESGLWPLVAARIVSVPVVSVLTLIATGSVIVAKGNVRLLAPAGLGEAAANICALIAYQRGPLAVAAVLSALFPVSTVLLARSILSERLLPVQSLGVVVALAAIPLVVWP